MRVPYICAYVKGLFSDKRGFFRIYRQKDKKTAKNSKNRKMRICSTLQKKVKKKSKKMQEYLVGSKKSSTFASAFAQKTGDPQEREQ